MKTFKEFASFIKEDAVKKKYHYFEIKGDVHHEFEKAKKIGGREFSHLPGKSSSSGHVGMYDSDLKKVEDHIKGFLGKKGYKEGEHYTIKRKDSPVEGE